MMTSFPYVSPFHKLAPKQKALREVEYLASFKTGHSNFQIRPIGSETGQYPTDGGANRMGTLESVILFVAALALVGLVRLFRRKKPNEAAN
jgi:hypothetical protein